MWIDSHCHLDHNRFLNHGGASEIVARAREQQVEGMLSVNCEIAGEFDDLLDMVRPLQNIWCSIGTHPHEAGLDAEKAITLDQLCQKALSDDKIIGIGESGLDYFYTHSPIDDQQTSFRKHIHACLETGMPLIIHARDADEDIFRILQEEAGKTNQRGLTGVFHCFSSGKELSQQGIDFGFYISFSGIITFKKSDELREIAKNVPLDRLLVETDAPFLTPEPYRKEMNEPKFVSFTGQVLSRLHYKNPEEMAVITKKNFFDLFTRAGSTWVN